MIIFPKIHKICESIYATQPLKNEILTFVAFVIPTSNHRRKSKGPPGKEPRSKEKRIKVPG